MTGPRSAELFEQARALFPGGVNSPVRAFRAVGGTPPFIASGSGSTVVDVDGRSYVDFVGSWGPLILGHAHPAVVEAIADAARGGTSFGAPHERELRLADLIISAMPSIQRLRFVSSGTEATMSALRVARAFTRRNKVLKFDGGYHGHSDGLLVAAGSGLLTAGLPASEGIPPPWAAETISVPYNDLGAVEAAFQRHRGEIAALIVEPVAGNMGTIPPEPAFLAGLQELTRRRGALLVFDEVITGFRVGPGGAQKLYGVAPDLTCLGKIIGGGLPVGAYGGRADVMALVAPEGPVYQAGTLSGNPVAMAAGIATLEELTKLGAYDRLETLGARLASGLMRAAGAVQVPLGVQRVGSMLTPFFCETSVTDEASAKRSDADRYARFFHGLLRRGVYPPPSQFEAWFVSLAHTEAEIDAVIAAAEEALRA
ncbi:MAG: glutamate-1-semialdehyde 2,1-aminomutase [Chloroflexi bacterium]|nr:glutamate-1-semialdehyde 2,1-aminomutase [Chloroflexota bacterium]